MSRLTLSLITAAALLFGVAPARADDDAQSALARKLLEVSGSGDIGAQIMEQMITQMRQVAPGEIPDEYWAELPERYDASDLVEQIVPIYTEHLSADEMTAAIEFYSSVHGKAIIEKMPTIMTESMLAGQKWGMGVAGQIMEELQARAEEEAAAAAAEATDS